jgi:hypothetical protein
MKPIILKNPNIEYLNPKQIQNSNFKTQNAAFWTFGSWSLDIV